MPLLEDVRRFTALRHATPALRQGDFSILHASDAVVVYCRRYEGQMAVIAFNSDVAERTLVLDEPLPATLHEPLSEEGRALKSGVPIEMAPRSGRIWLNDG